MNPATVPAGLLASSVLAWAYTMQPEMKRIEHDIREEIPFSLLENWLAAIARPETRVRASAGSAVAIICLIAGLITLGAAARGARRG